MESGSSVLVAAPTGAGKTVVGEFAAWLALHRGGKTFYTTPIKALSNQKFGDFLTLHGARDVGLLTGDNSINGRAPIVVMTTEVLRNMIYEDSPTLEGLHYVVLDEVHYLQDQYRGAVWEEILIHLPVDVQMVSLSATVSNAEEFGDWLQTLRGRTEVIIEEKRPVEIRHWYFAADELLPMFIRRSDGEVVPNVRAREFERRRRYGSSRPQRGGKRPETKRPRLPLRTEVVERLEGENMLPAIYFIFSRKGCDEAVKQCLREGVRLTSTDERRAIVEYAQERVAELSAGELEVLGYADWIEGLKRGLAAHHAGMIPPFKETIEELFASGLVKVVFATETLALGINMPARTVVVESLMKFTGEKHELMTAGEYTQLSGRAGRRGIDEVGHSVVLMQRFTSFDTISRLASTRTYPLQSSFRPSYNMSVNLVRNYDRAEAQHLVDSSFAQFQADRDVVQLEQTRERLEAYLASYRERMRCDLGDFEEYRQLHLRLREAGKGPAERGANRSMRVVEAMIKLRPGDVISITRGKRRGRYVVLQKIHRDPDRRPKVLVLSRERSMARLAPSDFDEPPRSIGSVALPDGFHVRDLAARRKVARRLSELESVAPVDGSDPAESEEVAALRTALAAHPCHRCPELARHLHFADRAARLEREVAGIERRIGRRTGTLARRFDDVLGVLEELDYVDHWALTPKGERLTRVYNESDLLVVETLEDHLLDNLEAEEVAAVCSTLVFESRGPEGTRVAAVMPTPESRRAWTQIMSLWRTIRSAEVTRGLELTREPDPGFAERAFRWAQGARLDEVLGKDDAPGDFVRSTKQLIDLLRQLEDVAAEADRVEAIHDAVIALHRGVVAYSSMEL
ncbi:MAG: DEAD/DEAH box helicase [Actinomycetota bacterium]|nr:DEAD/DEAH box helicase [Actinomycetota bacterium]